MSISYLALELAAPEHPGRWVGAMIVRLAIVGGLIWLVVWAIRKSRAPKYPQQPYPGGYYQQPPPPGPWPPPPGSWQQPPPPTWPPPPPPPWAPGGGGPPPQGR
ncbi:MAG: hypothetical protein AB1925_20710 [Actinomycetota bacterium]